MTKSDGTTTITLDHSIPDPELRATGALVDALKAAQFYLEQVAAARAARGVDTLPHEADRDTLLSLEHGYTRAAVRRDRDLGVLARAWPTNLDGKAAQ
jgi:hypothetical protein